MTLRRFGLAAIFLIAAAVVPALAQGPVHTKINFTITTPFELKKGGIVLPAGHYVLFRIEANNRHLFALYQDDMTHPPIAMIHTVPIYYDLGRLPSKTRILLETDESSSQSYPVLTGWNVPGDYGWQAIATVSRGGGLRSRYQTR